MYKRQDDKILTDFTPKAEEAERGDVNVTDQGDSESVKAEAYKLPTMGAKASEDGDAAECGERTYKSALKLLRKEQMLLEQQQRSNVVLEHELAQMSDRNGTLQNTVTELTSSVDLRNNELASLTKRADEVSRLLAEQVEEFRLVFRAVTRDSDEQLDKLAAENTRLKSELACLVGSFCGHGSTGKKFSERSTSADGETNEAIIRERLVLCVVPELLQTGGASSKSRKSTISPETEEEVDCSYTFYASCPCRTDVEKSLPLQELCCGEPADRLVIPVHCVTEDLRSEIDALRNTVSGRRCLYLAINSGQKENLSWAGDWKNATHHSGKDESVAADDGRNVADGQVWPTELPLYTDDQLFSCEQSLNILTVLFQGALQTGDDFLHQSRKKMKHKERQLTADHCQDQQRHNVSALLETTKLAARPCELDIDVQSTLCGSSAYDAHIPTQTPTPSKRHGRITDKTVELQSLDDIREFDHLLADLDYTGFVPESCVRKSARSSTSRRPVELDSVVYVGPRLLSFSCADQSPSLGDLVLEMRRQNARLAGYMSAVNSLLRQLDYSRDDAEELQTTISGPSGSSVVSTSLCRNPAHRCGDHSASAVAGPVVSAPVISSPFLTLSAVCLQRPMVVDLTTVASDAVDSHTVADLRRKLQVGYYL